MKISVPPIPAAISDADAFATLPTPIRFYVGVLNRKGMAPYAFGLTGSSGGLCIPTHQVLSACNDFEVRGLPTGTHAAGVIELHPVWDRADQKPISDPMNGQSLHLEARRFIGDGAITELVAGALPNTAASHRVTHAASFESEQHALVVGG